MILLHLRIETEEQRPSGGLILRLSFLILSSLHSGLNIISNQLNGSILDPLQFKTHLRYRAGKGPVLEINWHLTISSVAGTSEDSSDDLGGSRSSLSTHQPGMSVTLSALFLMALLSQRPGQISGGGIDKMYTSGRIRILPTCLGGCGGSTHCDQKQKPQLLLLILVGQFGKTPGGTYYMNERKKKERKKVLSTSD